MIILPTPPVFPPFVQDLKTFKEVQITLPQNSVCVEGCLWSWCRCENSWRTWEYAGSILEKEGDDWALAELSFTKPELWWNHLFL